VSSRCGWIAIRTRYGSGSSRPVPPATLDDTPAFTERSKKARAVLDCRSWTRIASSIRKPSTANDRFTGRSPVAHSHRGIGSPMAWVCPLVYPSLTITPHCDRALGANGSLRLGRIGRFAGSGDQNMSAVTFNATATPGVDPSRVRIAGAIKQAASTSGTNFEYLLTTAKMESDFNPTAGATT